MVREGAESAHPVKRTSVERKQRRDWAITSADNVVRQLAARAANAEDRLREYQRLYDDLCANDEICERIMALLPALAALVTGRRPGFEARLRRNVALHSEAAGMNVANANLKQLRCAQAGPRIEGRAYSEDAADPSDQKASYLNPDARPFEPGVISIPAHSSEEQLTAEDDMQDVAEEEDTEALGQSLHAPWISWYDEWEEGNSNQEPGGMMPDVDGDDAFDVQAYHEGNLTDKIFVGWCKVIANSRAGSGMDGEGCRPASGSRNCTPDAVAETSVAATRDVAAAPWQHGNVDRQLGRTKSKQMEEEALMHKALRGWYKLHKLYQMQLDQHDMDELLLTDAFHGWHSLHKQYKQRLRLQHIAAFKASLSTPNSQVESEEEMEPKEETESDDEQDDVEALEGSNCSKTRVDWSAVARTYRRLQ